MNLNIGERQSEAPVSEANKRMTAASTAGEPKANRKMEVTA
jgi:hypothetical protein